MNSSPFAVFSRSTWSSFSGPPLLEDLLELRAEVRHQAHLLGDHVDHLPLPVRLPQPVVDDEVVRAAAAQHPGLHGHVAVGFLAVADDGHLVVAVVVQATAVGRGQVALELALELRLLLGREGVPVAGQHETAEGVEIGVGEDDALHLLAAGLLGEVLLGEHGEHLVGRGLHDVARRLLRRRRGPRARRAASAGGREQPRRGGHGTV